jgi:hypothetical protein
VGLDQLGPVDPLLAACTEQQRLLTAQVAEVAAARSLGRRSPAAVAAAAAQFGLDQRQLVGDEEE